MARYPASAAQTAGRAVQLFYNPTQAYQSALLRVQNSLGILTVAARAPHTPNPAMMVPRAKVADPTMIAPAGAAYAVGGPTVRVSLNGQAFTVLPATAGSNYSIGRSSDSGIALSDPMVSGTHPILNIGPDGTFGIRDNGSSNGTFVNGERIAGELRQLQSGDEVVLGSSGCRLGFVFS